MADRRDTTGAWPGLCRAPSVALSRGRRRACLRPKGHDGEHMTCDMTWPQTAESDELPEDFRMKMPTDKDRDLVTPEASHDEKVRTAVDSVLDWAERAPADAKNNETKENEPCDATKSSTQQTAPGSSAEGTGGLAVGRSTSPASMSRRSSDARTLGSSSEHASPPTTSERADLGTASRSPDADPDFPTEDGKPYLPTLANLLGAAHAAGRAAERRSASAPVAEQPCIMNCDKPAAFCADHVNEMVAAAERGGALPATYEAHGVNVTRRPGSRPTAPSSEETDEKCRRAATHHYDRAGLAKAFADFYREGWEDGFEMGCATPCASPDVAPAAGTGESPKGDVPSRHFSANSSGKDRDRAEAWLDERGLLLASGYHNVRALAALLADVRRETIEECAKACDVEADAHNDSHRGTSSSDELLAAGDRARSARGCARRIRALHTKGASK